MSVICKYKARDGAFLRGFMFNKFVNYIKETRVELKSVQWPARSQTLKYTLLVIAVSVVTAVFLGFFDMVFTYLLGKFVL